MDWANSMYVADGKFIPNFVGIHVENENLADAGIGTRILEWMFNS